MLHVSDEQRIGQLFRESDCEAMEFLGLNERQLRSAENFQAYKSMERQKLIAEANGRIERAFVEGLGQLEAVIDSGVYFRMMALFGRDCWDDPEFLRSFQTKNPGTKPRSRARKTCLRMPGMRGNHGGHGEHGGVPSARARTRGGIIQ